MKLIYFYLIIINALGLVLMLSDKSYARNHKRRISEKSIFAVAFAGGALGIWLGMHIAKHKTRHWYFAYGMPVITVLNIFCTIGVSMLLT